MKKWEYAVATVFSDGNSITIRDSGREIGFAEMGRRGWELTTITTVKDKPMAFFKRELQRVPSIGIGHRDPEAEPA